MRLFCILSTSKNIFVYYCMNLVFSHNSLLPKCFPFFQIIQCRHRSQLQPRLSDILCRLEADEILQELHILLHFPQDLLVLTWKLHFLPLPFLFGLLPFPLFCLFQLLYFMNDFLNHLNQSWLVLVNLYICAPPQFTQDIYTWNLRTRYKMPPCRRIPSCPPRPCWGWRLCTWRCQSWSPDPAAAASPSQTPPAPGTGTSHKSPAPSQTECATFSNWPMLYRASALAILALVLCGAITSAFSASVQRIYI